MPLVHKELTDKIIAACFQVSNELGAGFLETVYQNALVIVLREIGLQVESEFPLSVSFHGQKIGSYYADLYIENKIIVELKAISALADVHKAQLINYLKATGTDVGLLVNFGNPRLEYRRFDNRSKLELIKSD